jgi:hypothetical protein
MFLAWAAWVVLQIVSGMKASWMNAVWVPLSLMILIIPSYASSLYARRYLGPQGAPRPPDRAWLWIALREAVPLGIILLAILAVRDAMAALPAEIPVGWSLSERALVWEDREVALRVLRHRTMVVYATLFGLEGVYLVWWWARRSGDIGRKMLSRPHWLFFWFKTAWVFFFAGLNLGFVDLALGGRSLVPYLLPGLAALSGFGAAVTLSRRASRVRES